ncbi:MAG TPA: DUF3489 domain-containing protein [Falsiroseomonas sp.]|jgi:hypothetical protein|nr:DUF3489 domain-containing protein [Falsiroseomonas sp.]
MGGDGVLLRITDAGLRAIGIEPQDAQSEADQTELGGLKAAEFDAERELAQRALEARVGLTAPDALEQAQAAGVVEGARKADMPAGGHTESTEGGQPSAGTAPAGTAPKPLTAPPESRTGPPAAQPRRALLATAQAVLLAWDDEAGQRAGLPDAVAALRGALAGKPARPPRDAAIPRKPREGTKQQQVLDLLRRPEGATIAHIAEATGWQAHTVRGFFAGLKKRQGIVVEVAQRIRQVGPGKEGAKGSYSIYRIADAR